jgi:hypothetical protein
MRKNVQEVMTWGHKQMEHPSQDWSGKCQSFCRQAYGVDAWADSALHAWGKIPRVHKVAGTDPSKAPRGAILYYAGGTYGHAALAAGIKTHDQCQSTDYVRQGQIDYAPRTFPRWGLRYLGYSFWTPFGVLPH